MSDSLRIVYVLKNERKPPSYYTGLTSNLHERLDAHNAGRCRHTAAGRPWHVDVMLQFADERRAVAFERYLKSGSGNAFCRTALALTSRVPSDRTSLSNCAKDASTPSINLPVDVSSIGSVADRSEMPSDFK